MGDKDTLGEDDTVAFLSIGTNLGDRERYLLAAMESLEKKSIKILAKSPIYETEPVGFADQPNFLNMVIQIATDLSAEELLMETMGIEKEQHRVRVKRWGPRTLDLDILFFGDQVIDEPHLLVPHPRASERAFIVLPLKDIAPDFIHPVLGVSIQELAKNVPGKEGVKKWKESI